MFTAAFNCGDLSWCSCLYETGHTPRGDMCLLRLAALLLYLLFPYPPCNTCPALRIQSFSPHTAILSPKSPLPPVILLSKGPTPQEILVPIPAEPATSQTLPVLTSLGHTKHSFCSPMTQCQCVNVLLRRPASKTPVVHFSLTRSWGNINRASLRRPCGKVATGTDSEARLPKSKSGSHPSLLMGTWKRYLVSLCLASVAGTTSVRDCYHP